MRYRHFLPVLVLAGMSQMSHAQSRPASPITDALQSLVDRGSMAGAVTVVADARQVLSLEAVGFADLAARRPMRADDVFWIASMTKSVTAAGVMLLVDDGKVSLDDPVERYLPEFADLWLAAERDPDHVLLRRPARKMTVRHLLSHTSGLAHVSALEHARFARTGRFEGETPRVLPLELAVRGYVMTPLTREPGDRWEYCNAGINTAGRLIEVVSGTRYEDFLARRLFEPLGMTDTTFSPTAEQLRRLAKCYDVTPTGLVDASPAGTFDPPLTGGRRDPHPAGGLFSTAADVTRFCQMLLRRGTAPDGRRVLSEAAIAEMTRAQVRTTDGQTYGLGLFTGWSGGEGFGHNGAWSTIMVVNPRRDLITIFLSQHTTWPPGAFDAFGEAVGKSFPRP
jgi:CubicO group peptidase (beta-lactamase class C family)